MGVFCKLLTLLTSAESEDADPGDNVVGLAVTVVVVALSAELFVEFVVTVAVPKLAE